MLSSAVLNVCVHHSALSVVLVPGADVLNQLAAMRRQLQTERARVENALDRQKVECSP